MNKSGIAVALAVALGAGIALSAHAQYQGPGGRAARAAPQGPVATVADGKIHAGGLDVDQHFAGLRQRFRQVFDDQGFRQAPGLAYDGFHVSPRSLLGL